MPPAVAVRALMAAQVYTWDEITAAAGVTPRQPRERSNEALKHFRDLAETPVGIPNGVAINTPLASPVVMIRKCTHGSGEQFSFEVGAELMPWSWRQMLLSLGSREA